MNWLHRHIKFAQNLSLSVNGLEGLKRSSMMSPDVPGQAYLFQGPEISEMTRLRGQNSPALIDQITQMMHNVFFILGEEMRNESNYDRKIDEDELDQEMVSYAEAIMQDYRFDGDKLWSMIGFLSSPDGESTDDPDDDSLRDAIKTVIGVRSGPPNSENFRTLYDQLKEAEKSVVKFYTSHRMGHNMEFDSNSVVQAWREGTREEQSGGDGSEIFNDALAAFTSEYLQAVVESETLVSEYYMEEELPPWLPEEGLIEAFGEHDRAIEWYIDEHKDGMGGLKEEAERSITENDAEYLEEIRREWVHKHGFDIIAVLSGEYDPEDEEDPRRDYTLSEISGAVQDLSDYDYLIFGAAGAPQKASAIIFAIKELASQDENLNFMFSNDLNTMTWDSRDVIRGMDGLAQENSQYVFGPFGDRIEQMRQRVEEQRVQEAERQEIENARTQEQADIERAQWEEENEIARQQAAARMEELQKAEDAENVMLPRRRSVTTPEQLQQMKDLGIAKRPFGHETQLSRVNFPGAGVFNDMRGMKPFRISIAPTKDYVDKGKIPPELMRNTLLHNVQTDGQPALGWVGGYADYNNKVLYIAEVQSDLMQRTVHMRDPEKVLKQREQEVATIQQQMTATQSKIQNAVSPKQQMQDKIDRINQENQQLSVELLMFESAPERQTIFQDEPSINRAKQKVKQNEDLMSRLQQQMPNVPDAVDTRNLELTIQTLNKSLGEAQQRLQESQKSLPRGFPGSLQEKYRPYHDYKSKVENTFKEWIPIFFNAAFRVARDQGYAAVRIVTSDNLMGLWDSYARDSTRTLFERVYDQTAKFYGAEKIQHNGQTWWEVQMTPETRVASWLQRLTKTATHEWLTQIPGGKFVWQLHIDKYFEIMRKEAPELAGDEQFAAQQDDYAKNEGRRSIFQMWLTQVPPELKYEDNLMPEFQQAVREYLIATQGFDPYVEEPEDVIPSADDLAQQWGPENGTPSADDLNQQWGM